MTDIMNGYDERFLAALLKMLNNIGSMTFEQVRALNRLSAGEAWPQAPAQPVIIFGNLDELAIQEGR